LEVVEDADEIRTEYFLEVAIGEWRGWVVFVGEKLVEFGG
jgi:hypothetical protein